MTFQEQYDDAASHGLTIEEMRRNCEAQRAFYLRRAKWAEDYGTRHYLWATGERWRERAAQCDAMLRWLDERETKE